MTTILKKGPDLRVGDRIKTPRGWETIQGFGPADSWEGIPVLTLDLGGKQLQVVGDHQEEVLLAAAL